MYQPSDAEVNAGIEEFDGDMREAIRALLHDVAVLAAGLDATVSHRYGRSCRESVARLTARGRGRSAGEET